MYMLPFFFPRRLKKEKMTKGRNLKVKRICRSFMEKKKKPLIKELYMLSELVGAIENGFFTLSQTGMAVSVIY